MDERSPLDNRSLSHTSREPEGQAWAQIGTKSTNSVVKAQTVLPPPTITDPPPETSTSPSRVDEDAMSDDGRPLQVVEDAEPERLNEASNEASNDASNPAEEKKDSGDAAPSSSDAEKSDDRIDPEYGIRDRTNSSDPKMIRARVFVGHLNTDKCSRTELEKLFSPFGKVASCSLQNGYGFVQYCEEQAAKRAITELHGLQFKGMKLVVDKTAALKKILGENPNAPKPWSSDRDERFYDMDIRRREAAAYMYERELYERSTRLELERMYYERYPYPPPRDPYNDRYYDRTPSFRDPYTEGRYRTYPEMDRGRYHERAPFQGSYDRGYYDSREGYYDGRDRSSYDRPRDDPYERRDKDPYRDHQLRDREPFERFDSSRRL